MSIKDFRKKDPKAMVPTEIASLKKTEHPILLRGYYVKNTEYYNIMPISNDAIIDHNRINNTPIGFILPENPFKSIGIDDNRFQMRRIDIDNNISSSDRLKTKHRKDVMPLQQSEIELLLEKIDNSFPNLINKKEDYLYSNSEQVVGYFDQGQLHLIQLSTLIEIKIESYSLKLDVFSRNTGTLESGVMLNKKAVFIGCGSVGSLVAVELAKAGVGSFMLVDMDIFGYHNICRHQCGIYDVGRYKTDAVSDRILQINPFAKIKKYNCAIQDVDVDELRNYCDNNTIIIGGADNRDGDHYACKFAMEKGSAFISIGCWERAFAGEIFYCLAGMPDYSDFVDAIGYISGRITQNRRFYTTEEDLEKVSFEPGISADINFVTIIAVKMAIDLLNRDNQNFTQRVIPHLTQYTLICNTNEESIGGEQAEIFSYPLQVSTSITVPYSNNK